jgi:hypothetical protein
MKRGARQWLLSCRFRPSFARYSALIGCCYQNSQFDETMMQGVPLIIFDSLPAAPLLK